MAADGQLKPADLGVSATLRLLGGAARQDRTYVVGVDIAMSPGSHTYWKMPGDAGVPPVFSFDGSKNVTSATVRFPTPKRITEEGLMAFGYGDHVVFPVVVTAQDAAKPAVLKADVTYAVCNRICIPEHSQAELILPSDASAANRDLVTTALAAVPVPMTAAQTADLTLTPVAGTPKPTWTIVWTGSTPIEDVFANAPEGYFFDTRAEGPRRWTLTAAQLVVAPNAKKVPVELTLATKGGGLVTTETLDVAGAAK